MNLLVNILFCYIEIFYYEEAFASKLWNCYTHKGFSSSSVVNNLPVMRETQFQSLGGKDPLEESMAAHSSILAWRIPWTEEPGRLQSIMLQRVVTALKLLSMPERINQSWVFVGVDVEAETPILWPPDSKC